MPAPPGSTMFPMIEDICQSLHRGLSAAERSLVRAPVASGLPSADSSSGDDGEPELVIRPSLPPARDFSTGKISDATPPPLRFTDYLTSTGSGKSTVGWNATAADRTVERSSGPIHQVAAAQTQFTQSTTKSGPAAGVDVPAALCDVRPDVAASGAVTFLGCLDARAASVVVICCRHSAWLSQSFSITELSRLILYYRSLRSEQVREKGLTLIADVRRTNINVINTLLDTLLLTETSSPGAVHIVHILADREAQSMLLRSPAFGPQNHLKMNLLMSSDAVYRIIERRYLPLELGGDQIFPQSHSAWLSFQQQLEQFVSQCRSTAELILRASRDIMTSSSASPPRTTTDVRQTIDRHRAQVNNLLAEPQLVALRSGETQATLRRIVETASRLIDRPDVSESLDVAKSLLSHVTSACERLLTLADNRQSQLTAWFSVTELQASANKVFDSLQSQRAELLNKFHASMLADNFQGITVQKQDFERFQLNVSTEMAKGRSLIDEARRMIASCEFAFTDGILDQISEDMAAKISEFANELDQGRARIETAVRCYDLLSQLYEWAVNAIRFVAVVRVENEATVENLNALLAGLETYLKDHPAASSEVLQSLFDQCSKVNSSKLLQQCETARAKNLEAVELISTRQAMLRQAKENLENEQRQKASNGVILRPNRSARFGGLSTSCSALDDHLACLRRRSYAGKPSTPVYGAMAAAFKGRFVDIQEYEEHLLAEGLITDNMSERIVTSLPKCLSDSTMRGSRESLRTSRDSIRSSQESLVPASSSESLAVQMTVSESGILRRQAVSHWQMLKRAVGRFIDGGDVSANQHRQNIIESPAVNRRLHDRIDDDRPSSPGCQSAASWSPASTTSTASWSPTSSVSQFVCPSSFQHSSTNCSAAVSEDNARRHRAMSMILREMIQTERDYVASLQFILDNYLPELSRDDVVQPLRGKRGVIFGNVEKIYDFHSRSFLHELEACEGQPLRVVEVFLRHTSDFYLYALYSKNKPKSDALMTEYGTAFFKKKQLELGDRLDLNSYLLKPVQRMAKYALLLEQFMKECSHTDSAYGDLMEALEMVRFQLRHGNDLLAMDCIRDCDVNLCEQGMLLRQDEFVVWQGRKKMTRRVFLFEEMVLFSKTKRRASGNDCYIYKNSIKTSEIGLTENIADSNGSERKFELWFRRQAPGVTYVLQAPTMACRRAWLADISCILWRQAIRNRERRRSEMVQTGRDPVPSAVVLRTEPELIRDRLLGISLTSGGVPRVRNSIAVTSYDQLRTGSKRTHSLVSIESSSSSSSSGALNGNRVSLGTMAELPVEVAQDGGCVENMFGSTYVQASLQRLSASNIREDVSTQTTLRRPPCKKLDTTTRRTQEDGRPLLCDGSGPAGYVDEDGIVCSDV